MYENETYCLDIYLNKFANEVQNYNVTHMYDRKSISHMKISKKHILIRKYICSKSFFTGAPNFYGM